MFWVMKLSLTSALLLILSVASGSAQAESTYTSDDLHFTFTYPAFVVPSADAAPAVPPAQRATKDTAAILDCVSFPLAAKRDGGDTDFDLLTINRLDFKCGKSPAPTAAELRQAARDTVTGPLTGMPGLTLSQPIAYKLNGTDALFIRASAGDSTQTAYAATTCTVVQSNLLCWTALSSSRSRVDAMLAGPITFAGHLPQPLVPAAIFAQPIR